MRTLVLMVASLGLASQPAAAQKKLPTVAEVLGKLKEKRDSGGIQVYKLEFEITTLQNGRAAETWREAWELQIDWKTGKFRQAGWKGWSFKPFEILKVYDGEKIKTQFRDVTKEGKPVGDGAWKYGLGTGRMNSANFQGEYWPVFFHKGVIGALRDHFYPGHLVFDPDAEKFFVHDEVVRNGRKCISLKTFPENPVTPMQLEYIIDPKKDYAVVEFLYTRGNAPVYSIDIDVGETKQPGRWVPRGWTRTVFAGRAEVIQVQKVKVTSFAEDVKIGENNKFDIVPPEGAKVGRSHYEWPEGQEDLTRTEYWYQVKNGKLVQIGGPAPPLWDRISENKHWFALAAGLAAAAFIGFRVRRGWRRGPTAPPAPAGE
jgi:hypothetical protein